MKFKTSKHIYAHIDCDSFFASCEVLRNPALQNSYVCVGSEIIVAASYNAKRRGVKVGTPIWEAQKILQSQASYFCAVDMGYYKGISAILMQYLQENTLDVRIFSVDEAFVDITGLAELQGISLEQYTRLLQQDILDTVGIPVSIGVSNTRLKAKIFSKLPKPFGIYIGIDSRKEQEIFRQLSFREIPFIGIQISHKLKYRVETIADYIHLGYFQIMKEFGKNGGKIWFELCGVSSMQFLPRDVQKSIGRAGGFNKDMTSDPKILLQRIGHNLDRICETLYRQGYEIQNISLLLIDADWKKYRIEKRFPLFMRSRIELFSILQTLFFQIYIPGKIYRKTGIFSSEIQSIEQKQLSLFERENRICTQNQEIEKAFYDIEQKYGKGLLRLGV